MLTRPAAPRADPDGPDFILEGSELIEQPPARRGRVARRVVIGIGLLLLALILFLALTAPLSKSLKPITAPSITLFSAEGRPIARKGSVTDLPVDAAALPPHIPRAFLAIEDARFYEHLGIDPWGLARAGGRNLFAGGVVEGGSTITQQLAKLAFLSSDQTIARKVQEAFLAVWLEAWLSKDEILSRYMSSVYFGDNVYGLRAAANHYFSRRPEELSVEQVAMLAGLLKAPSTLAPTRNLKGARERGELVTNAMVRNGWLDPATAEKLPTVELRRGPVKDVPNGTYFADWVLSNMEGAEPRYGEQRIVTTLEDRLQRHAAQVIRAAGIGGAQVALVSMRPDGRVVAMVGGRSYRQSPFNRVTQAKRQSGSTFKVFVYLAALRAGYSPSDTIEDRPIRLGNWSPGNYADKYRGIITLREAFAYSSNVAAVRLAERVGRPRVVQAARDLGVTSDIEPGPTMTLGTSNISLMEMTSAFAAIAKGAYPVRPRGLPDSNEDRSGTPFEGSVRRNMMELLWAVTHQGSGRGAALPVPTFGKTGTSQESRDAYFIGFAGDLVTGVWIGNDNNSPVGDVQGGGLPARIWRAFMLEAVKNSPAPAAAPVLEPIAADPGLAPVGAPLTGPGYDVGGYDVDDAPLPAAPVRNDGGSLVVSEEEEVIEEGPVDEDAPLPGRRDIPTIAPPPPPPSAEDELQPEEDDPTAL